MPKGLENFTQLKRLTLNSGTGLDLSKLTQLKHLSLHTSLNQKDLDMLSRLKSLESLDLTIGVVFPVTHEVVLEANWPNMKDLSIELQLYNPTRDTLDYAAYPFNLKLHLAKVQMINIGRSNYRSTYKGFPVICEIQADHIDKLSLTNAYLEEIAISTTKLDSLFVPIDILSRIDPKENQSLYTANYLNVSSSSRGYESQKIDQEAALSKAFFFRRLTSLEWTGNFEKIPDTILACDSLRFLRINSSNLRELPQHIGKLSHLETLIVVTQRLKKIPRSLAECTALKSIICHGSPHFKGKKIESRLNKVPNFL